MTGERSAHRDVDLPENFDEWSREAQVQFIRGAMKRPAILDEIVALVGCDDREVNHALTKDQATQVLLRLRELGAEGE